MNKEFKNRVIDVLKSDDMRVYIEEIIREQMTIIISSEHVEYNSSEGNKELEEQLLKEKGYNKKLLLRIEELEKNCNNYLEIYKEKNNEIEIIFKQKQESDNEVALLKEKNMLLETRILEAKTKYNQDLKKENTEKKIIISKLEEYENTYACINKAYSTYKALPESIKQRLGNIFIRDNIYAFIVAISDWDNIEGIWTFTKRRIIEDEVNGVKELVELFTNAFTLFNLIDDSGRYEFINPQIGERFNSDKHSIKGTKTDGYIERVLLSGIYDSLTRNAIFKAVVKI